MQESPYLEGSGFLAEKLQSLPVLGSGDQKYLKDILRFSKIRKFEDREIITKEKTFDYWIYILFTGAVKVTKNGEEIARMSEVGSTFGELAAIDGKMRSASVEADGETVCMAIDTTFLNETADPLEKAQLTSVLYRFLGEVIAKRLRNANDEIINLRAEIELLRRQRWT